MFEPHQNAGGLFVHGIIDYNEQRDIRLIDMISNLAVELGALEASCFTCIGQTCSAERRWNFEAGHSLSSGSLMKERKR